MHAFRPFVLLSSIGVASIASAQSVEFSANHVFVSDYNLRAILEFDETGAQVRAIDVSNAVNLRPTGVTFGADGLLYFGSALSDQISGMDGSGAVDVTIANPAILNVESVEFDALGRPLATSLSLGDIVRLSADGSSATVLYDGSSPLFDLEFDDYGFLVTSDGTANHARFFEVDGSGALTNALSLAAVSPAAAPRGLAIEFGSLITSSDFAHDRVLFGTSWWGAVPEPFGVPLAQTGIEDIDYAPNGRLLVVDSADGELIAVDRDGTSDVFASTTHANPYLVYLAIAPFRFDAVVRGQAEDGSGTMVPILESAVVSIQPATRRVMFQFTDDAQKADDFVSVTGLDRFVANGKVSGIEAPGSTRSFQARARRDATARNAITVTCDTKRKFDAAGFERVVSATGSLWCGGEGTQIRLSFKTKKLRNP